MDVIDKTVEENLNVLPLLDNEKKRLRGQVSGLVEGIKRTFPPLQIISSAISMVSSFTSYKARIERLGRKSDSLIVEATYPITKEIITKINMHMSPYIDFYNLLNKTNTTYENALYNHEIEYKDFIEEVKNLQIVLEGTVNINESIGEQINVVFDLANSSRQDFDFRKIDEDEKIRNLAGNCLSVYNLVERYKKFTSDFIAIQDGFYSDYIVMLEQVAQKLPMKDEGKIGRLIADLNFIKKGNPSENVFGFEDAYRTKLKSITTKLVALNRARF
jgi:hypothetical protein